MLPECWTSSATATTSSSVSSNPKKAAATLVEGLAPPTIRTSAPIVNRAVRICQGIFTCR